MIGFIERLIDRFCEHCERRRTSNEEIAKLERELSKRILQAEISRQVQEMFNHHPRFAGESVIPRHPIEG